MAYPPRTGELVIRFRNPVRLKHVKVALEILGLNNIVGLY